MTRKVLLRILIVAAALITSFLLVEIALRVMNYHPILMEMDMFVEKNNDLLPYSLKPNYEGNQVGKYVKIDGNGNRIIKPKIANTSDDVSEKTILILGDSVVFGFGLENDETIASQFQNLINKNDSKHVVKNISAPGYTSWNEYEALRLYLNEHEVDIVILFYVFNDITKDNNALRAMRQDQKNEYSPLKRVLYKNIYSLTLINQISSRIKSIARNKERSGRNTSNVNNVNVVDQLYSAYLNQEALDYSMDAISKIKSLCVKNNIELIVVLPRFHIWYYNHPQFSEDFEKEIIARLNQIGINGYIAKAHVENLSVEDINVHENDFHPSALAVKYIVDEIYEKIENGK